jgi:hypothetical protein
VLEALRALVNGIYAAVSDLEKPPAEEKPLSIKTESLDASF